MTLVYSIEVKVPSGTGNLQTLCKVTVNNTMEVYKIRFNSKPGHLLKEIVVQENYALKLHYDLE